MRPHNDNTRCERSAFPHCGGGFGAIWQMLLVMLLAVQSFTVVAQPHSAAALEARAEEILSQLTLEEKLSLMEHRNPAIERVGLPAYSWWNEALHGVGRNGVATVWPMPIALAATFDTEMVYNIFRLTSSEARFKHHQAQAAGEYGDYTGLTFFTPNINIFRDPRWGRGMETYGEDPFLTAQMGLACVRGLQQHDTYSDGRLSAAACLKHYAVHSGPEGARHRFDAEVSSRDLWSTYLPAFEYIIQRAPVQQVMCAYNRTNGAPCCTNRELLVEILRNRWHYDGLLVTDCWALNDCWERDTVIPRHETHPTAASAAADAFGSEVDLECGSGLSALRTAVDSGWITEEKIDEHVRRILLTRLRVTAEPTGATSDAYSHPAGETVREAAASTLVLLQNNGVLPLRDPQTRIFLTGPNAADTLMPLGNYNGTPRHTSTIQEGLSECFHLTKKLRDADVIVYAGGLSPQLEGEELPVDIPGFYKGDRTRIELPQEQVEELKKLKTAGRPIILLLCTGSAIALEEIVSDADAIVVCWYGGEQMGSAIAQTLAGHLNRFGRLPITFYRSTSQLSDFSNYDMSGRTYRYMEQEPLFAFGYGLSYSRFTLKEATFDSDALTVRGSISNEGAYDGGQLPPGRAVVQVYLRNLDDPMAPKKSLVGVSSILLESGTTKEFSISIDPFWLRGFDEQSQEPSAPSAGTHFEIEVAFSSAPAPGESRKILYTIPSK